MILILVYYYDKFNVVCHAQVHNANNIKIIQVASLALLLAAIGGSDMLVQHIFVIHVYLGMHQSEVYEL